MKKRLAIVLILVLTVLVQVQAQDDGLADIMAARLSNAGTEIAA